MAKFKILAVLPEGGKAAEHPKYVNCVERGLGLREFAKEKGGEVIITADKEGPNSEFARNLPDSDILITTPFHPAYVKKQHLDQAKKLKLLITAGVGSDHIDLRAAADHNLTVAEVTGSNVVSVAEDEIMRTLILIRNFVEGHDQIKTGDWNVPAVAVHSYDIENKVIGTFGAGRIGWEYMKRLKPWNLKRVYYDRHRKQHFDDDGVEWINDMDEFLKRCDVVTINVPLTDKTRGIFNRDVIAKMHKGAYLVNNARGAICERQAVVEALENAHLSGYGGDVWDEQPAPKDHPWRYMPHNAMTPHTSGTTLDAQGRYQAGTLEMLNQWLEGKPLKEENYIVREGKLAEQYT